MWMHEAEFWGLASQARAGSFTRNFPDFLNSRDVFCFSPPQYIMGTGFAGACGGLPDPRGGKRIAKELPVQPRHRVAPPGI